jgi:hypothetical protein
VEQNANLTLLKKGTVLERSIAAKWLGEHPDKQAVPDLIRSLKDPSASVQGHAAWALGKIKDESAIEPLIDALQERMAPGRGKGLSFQRKSITSLYVALESITGKKYGLDVEKWKEYAKVNKEESK